VCNARAGAQESAEAGGLVQKRLRLSGRKFALAQGTPLAVRGHVDRSGCAIKRALAYVLNNARKHGVWSSPTRPDPFSSGRWYTGWYEGVGNICRPLRAPPVAGAGDLYLTMPSFRCLSIAFVPGQLPRESALFDPGLHS